MPRRLVSFCLIALGAAPIVAFSAAPLARTGDAAGGTIDVVARAAAEAALATQIDGALDAAWSEQKITPAPAADETTWLRRLSVDLVGSIPTATEVAAFLADTAPDKRGRKIEQYLADPRFAENEAVLWSDLLLSQAGKDAKTTKPWLRSWLTDEFAAGTPFREVVRTMLASVDSKQRPDKTAFVISYREAIESLAGMSARAFLGLQIQCAQCHDHPFDSWTRDQFNQFTAFFVDLRGDLLSSGKRGAPIYRVVDGSMEWDLKDRVRKAMTASRGGDAMAMAGGAMANPDAMTEGQPMGSSDPSPSMRPQPDATAEPMKPRSNAPVDEKAPEIRELTQICRSLPGDDDPNPPRESDLKRLEKLAAKLMPSLKEPVDRYLDRRKLFGTAMFLDGKPYAPEAGKSKRATVADWVVAEENPWFARAITNRLWGDLFGYGLVEPLDDLSPKSDRIVTPVADLLAKEFLAHGTDLRFLIGALVRTRAYGLANSACAEPTEAVHEERWFAAHPLRAMNAAQMSRSLLLAQGIDPDARDNEAMPEVRGTPRSRLLHYLPKVFQEGTGRDDNFTASIPQSLFLMNGGYGDDTGKLREAGLLARFLDKTKPAAERVAGLFLATLSRPPTEREVAGFAATLAAVDAAAEPIENPTIGGAKFDDVFWALVNSTEFHTNH